MNHQYFKVQATNVTGHCEFFTLLQLKICSLKSLHFKDFLNIKHNCVQHTRNKTCSHEKLLMFKYGRLQKKVLSWLVCGSHGAYLDCMLPVWGSSHRQVGTSFYVQVVYVIMKIVILFFNRPSLLSKSLVGQCTGNKNTIVLYYCTVNVPYAIRVCVQ